MAKKIHAKDLQSATKLVDMIYRTINPRVGDWVITDNYKQTCVLRDGRQITLIDTGDGIEMVDTENRCVRATFI